MRILDPAVVILRSQLQVWSTVREK